MGEGTTPRRGEEPAKMEGNERLGTRACEESCWGRGQSGRAEGATLPLLITGTLGDGLLV